MVDYFAQKSMAARRALIFTCALLIIAAGGTPVTPVRAQTTAPPCAQPGWFPEDFNLKDHHIFIADDHYYLVSIYIGPEGYENRFAYAVSDNLCTWEHLGFILTERISGAWDENAIWSPFVLAQGGTYYLFYTGVTRGMAQSIMLAISTNPADPSSWQPYGMIFQPDHAGTSWQGFDFWSDCRDPFVWFDGEMYYLFYTASDVDGGILGLATATAPGGIWTDYGATLRLPPGDLPESPTLTRYNGLYYLVYHHVGTTPRGAVWSVAPTLNGPWQTPRSISPGWAHEFFEDRTHQPMISYLTTYDVNVQPLQWLTRFNPPMPWIGSLEPNYLFFPILYR